MARVKCTNCGDYFTPKDLYYNTRDLCPCCLDVLSDTWEELLIIARHRLQAYGFYMPDENELDELIIIGASHYDKKMEEERKNGN